MKPQTCEETAEVGDDLCCWCGDPLEGEGLPCDKCNHEAHEDCGLPGKNDAGEICAFTCFNCMDYKEDEE